MQRTCQGSIFSVYCNVSKYVIVPLWFVENCRNEFPCLNSCLYVLIVNTAHSRRRYQGNQWDLQSLPRRPWELVIGGWMWSSTNTFGAEVYGMCPPGFVLHGKDMEWWWGCKEGAVLICYCCRGASWRFCQPWHKGCWQGWLGLKMILLNLILAHNHSFCSEGLPGFFWVYICIQSFGHLWAFLKKLKVVWLAHLGLHGASNVADERDMFHIDNQWSLLEGWKVVSNGGIMWCFLKCNALVFSIGLTVQAFPTLMGISRYS